MAHALLVPPQGYEAGALLGRGALGVTFVVTRGGDAFVCKRLASRMAHDVDARAVAHDEARVLEALDGRGAPRLVEQGDDDHGPFLVQTTVAGASLAAWIATREASGGAPFAPAWLAEIARAAFVELAAVHGARDRASGAPLDVVHGDLSVDNVLATASTTASTVGIVDFGLARFRGATRAAGKELRGTARYAAPEVARGEHVDARADLFAMAASLLHFGSGIAPHAGTVGAALLVQAGDGSLEAYARTAGAFFPADVARGLARCVAFARGDRPPRAEDVFGADPW